MSRLLFERLCRGMACVALLAGVVLSWQTHRDEPSGGHWRALRVPAPAMLAADTDAADGTAAFLVREARNVAGARDTLLLPLSVLPSASTRAAMGAMRLAGIPLRWMDSTGASGLAISVTREATPRAAFEVRVSRSKDEMPLRLRDAGGLLDSLAFDTTISTSAELLHGWRIATLAAPVQVRAGSALALQREVPDATSKRLMVLALPGWESRFAIAALEEIGWQVDGVLRTSPTGAVTVGSPQRLDTLRYAAVVVLDSMNVDAPGLLRFVRQGGGLVLSGDALRIPALAGLSPVRARLIRNATAGALLTPTPRRGLDAWELEVLPGAEVLLRDPGSHGHEEVVVASHRLGAGRLVASGYRQLWRWRMEGTDDGIEEHRRWWSLLVAASVPDARTPPTTERAVWPGDVSPYADLVALADRPLATPPKGLGRPGAAVGFRRLLPAILLGLTALSLLAEWASRRLRGLR